MHGYAYIKIKKRGRQSNATFLTRGGAFVLGGLLGGLFAGVLLSEAIYPRGFIVGGLLSGWLLSVGFLSRAFKWLPFSLPDFLTLPVFSLMGASFRSFSSHKLEFIISMLYFIFVMRKSTRFFAPDLPFHRLFETQYYHSWTFHFHHFESNNFIF